MSCPIFHSWWGNVAGKGKGTGPLLLLGRGEAF